MADIIQTTILNAFLGDNSVWISIKISPNFVSKIRINNIPALAQIMAWRRSGDMPLSEPMMVLFTDTDMRHAASMSQVTAPQMATTHYLDQCWNCLPTRIHTCFTLHQRVEFICYTTSIFGISSFLIRNPWTHLRHFDQISGTWAPIQYKGITLPL